MRFRGHLVLFFVPCCAAACTLIADFPDKERDASVLADGAIVVSPDGGSIVIEPPVDGGGSVTDADAAEPVPDAGPFTCANQPDGTAVPGTQSRCCNHRETAMNTSANCGACGITCDVAHGHSCQVRGERPMCVGCKVSDGGVCWSGCCVAFFSSPDGVCVPSTPLAFCVPCDDDVCRAIAPNSSCQRDNLAGNTCAY